MWLKHQPELVNVRITPKQFADARADVESDFGILVKKNFVLTGINALNRLAEFRDGAMALRVAFDDLVRVHSELHDPESIGERLLERRQRRGASRQRHRLQHQARRHGIRANLRPRGHAAAHRRRSQEHAPGLPGAAPDRIEIAESDDISVQSFIDGEGAIPTLNECHRALCEAIGRIR